MSKYENELSFFKKYMFYPVFYVGELKTIESLYVVYCISMCNYFVSKNYAKRKQALYYYHKACKIVGV